MNALIVDDEAPGRRALKRLLASEPDVRVAGEAGSVDEALRLIESERPDLLFLDIQLRGETGFDLLAALPEPRPRTVFVTAWDHYAVRAFECDAVDYLLKPVRPERLAQTLRRLRESAPVHAGEEPRALIKSEGVWRWLPWRNILFIRAEGNYSAVALRDGERLIVHRPLKEWIARMPDGFLQIHRRHLVQLAEIQQLIYGHREKKRVVLRSGMELEVGRLHWPTLRERVVGQEK